jgi:hypothetical protein
VINFLKIELDSTPRVVLEGGKAAKAHSQILRVHIHKLSEQDYLKRIKTKFEENLI